jgi:hypothetical protein
MDPAPDNGHHMAEDQLRTVIDGIRARLQAELESHLGSLADTHHQALQEARRNVEADAEQKWAAKLHEERAGWGARLESEVAAARAEAERLVAAEAARVRLEADQSAAAAIAQARRELEESLRAERTRAQSDLERAHADRERAQADLERAHAELERAHSDHERAHADRLRTQEELHRVQEALARSQEAFQRTQHAHQGSQHEFKQAQDALQRVTDDLHNAQQAFQQTSSALLQTTEELQRTREDLQRMRDEFQTAQMQLAIARTQAAELRADADRARADAASEFERAHAMAADSVGPPPESNSSAALLDAIRGIDEAQTLSAALSAAVRGAALASPRVALFLISGTTLQEWPVEGVASLGAGELSSVERDAGFLADALREGQPQSIDGSNGRTAPAFAGLPPGRGAIAVPFVLGGQPVALLYADEGRDGQPLESWRDSVQILGRHASAFLACLTTVRTAQALRLISAAGSDSVPAADDEAPGARRYARLLLSEIKMYNDGAVRAGCERRDLLQRLEPEIDRARQLYEERIAPSPARDLYFRQELVQTLANGDSSLLG